jgi:hypothetical protein
MQHKTSQLVFFTLLLLHASLNLSAQDKKDLPKRPDLPGTFLIELGFNRPQDAPDNFDYGFWGSRTMNVYYQYDFTLPFLKSKFTLSPAIGLGMDRYKFTNNYTLEYESGTNDLVMNDTELDIKKSQLITNYLDMPIELRYTKNPVDPSRSFKIAIGFRAGILISSFTKLKYDAESEIIKEKIRRDWNLNDYRYGVYGKIGVGNVNLFGYYNSSTLFETGEGPDGRDINNVTIGISLGGF